MPSPPLFQLLDFLLINRQATVTGGSLFAECHLLFLRNRLHHTDNRTVDQYLVQQNV
jgi:hypothetical protein